MDKNFNDLFDMFFNRRKPNKKSSENTNDFFSEEIKRVLNMLENNTRIDDLMESQILDNLGKPDKTEFYEQDGLFYERRTWHTPQGDLVELIVTSEYIDGMPPKQEKPLKEQLDEAVANEEYEKAAAIRDKMNKKK